MLTAATAVAVAVAIYARVSSEQQAAANTIASQLSILKQRIQQDGLVLTAEMEFIDDGYSGSTLIRPALERMRDAVALGAITRLYVYDPDRLARKYAYQVLLIDELQRAGVTVTFINGRNGTTAEDELLLQVQGMISEYERIKIKDRCRRGRLYSAQAGKVSVLGKAPYGYRYITKQEGGGQARYEIVPAQARVVAQIFHCLARERLTISEVSRRLNNAGEPTYWGKARWDRSTIVGMLNNPIYCGKAAYGKTKVGPRRTQLRLPQRQSQPAKYSHSIYQVESSQWIYIPAPAIVSLAVFEQVQAQLVENRKYARQQKGSPRFLLQGIIVCQQCGYGCYGKSFNSTSDYGYYRCRGSDAYRFGGESICANRPIRADKLDQIVWAQVSKLLENPKMLEQEYQRRLKSTDNGTALSEKLTLQMTKLQQGIARLIDTYAEGYIDKKEFEPRIKQLKARLLNTQEQAKELADEAALQAQLHLIIGKLEDFAANTKANLEKADFAAKCDIVRTLVKRVEVLQGQVNLIFRINPVPFDQSPERGFWQHCWWRYFAAARL
jgi:site-specific DNA recombinase